MALNFISRFWCQADSSLLAFSLVYLAATADDCLRSNISKEKDRNFLKYIFKIQAKGVMSDKAVPSFCSLSITRVAIKLVGT